MKNKKQTNCNRCGNRYKLFVILLIAVIIIGAGLGAITGIMRARAEGNVADKYTGVIEDLSKDESFNVNDYPAKPDDYSIRIIQIAESADGELFVYTYQACQNTVSVVATEINMSLSESAENTSLYGLTLLSVDGVLCKYVVNGIAVSAEPERHYNITSVYRKRNTNIPADASNATATSIAYNVGQLWTVKTVENGVEYSMSATETIEITSQMIGFRRYNDGFMWANTKKCDAHYLLFSCNYKIDSLISAEISYSPRKYEAVKGSETKYIMSKPVTVTLHYDDVVSNDGSGWFGKKERWRRMVSVDEFMKDVELTETEQKVFAEYDWVLNFLETEYTCEAGGKDVLITALVPFGFVWTIVNGCTTKGTIVRDVTLFRLEFECDDEIYNLGVVSDRHYGTDTPSNPDDKVENMLAWFKNTFEKIAEFFRKYWYWLVVGAVAVIALIILAPFMPSIIHLIINGTVWLFKGLVWLVSLPFRGIVALVRKIMDKSE